MVIRVNEVALGLSHSVCGVFWGRFSGVGDGAFGVVWVSFSGGVGSAQRCANVHNGAQIFKFF